MKIFLIVITSLVVIALAFFMYILLSLPDFKPKVSKVELYSDNFGEKIFVKKKVWGITGDHQVIVVSKSSEDDFEPNENREYVFKGLSPFFYKFENDTLDLYVGKESKVPQEMPLKIEINQIVLSNPDMITLMESYKEKGLKTIE